MFRFVLQTAFIRRVLQIRFFRFLLLVLLAGCLIAGLVYAYLVFNTVNERSHDSHVHSRPLH